MEGLENYLLKFLEGREQTLLEMEEYAKKRSFPIVGALTGQALMQYAKLIDARRILELGSGFGYSAIWFSKGAPYAEIICTDMSKENKDKALNYFIQMGLKNIKFIVGEGLQVLNQLKGNFDIIFNDIEKIDYPEAFKRAIPRLNKGGLLITDNVLWHGTVVDTNSKSDSTRAVQEYNKLAFSDPRVISNINPVRDGICVSLKL